MADLNQTLANARRLMTPEMDAKIDSMRGGRGNIGGGGNYPSLSESLGGANNNNNYGYQEKQMPDFASQFYNSGQGSGYQPYPTSIPENINLPREITDSFMNNPINIQDPSIGASLMDSIDPKIINEQYPPQQQQAPQHGNTVNPLMGDITMFKGLIKECVREVLKESGVGGATAQDNSNIAIIQLGSSLRLVDSKGNIYEAVLKKKGSINKKN